MYKTFYGGGDGGGGGGGMFVSYRNCDEIYTFILSFTYIFHYVFMEVVIIGADNKSLSYSKECASIIIQSIKDQTSSHPNNHLFYFTYFFLKNRNNYNSQYRAVFLLLFS